MNKLIFMLAASFFILSGCTEDKLIGTWIQPIPGRENQFQGIRFNKDGSAASVNMHTLQYDSWQRKNNHILVLTGYSIGNGHTITIEEEFEIQQLDENSLKLRFNDAVFSYTRQKPNGE